MALKAVLETLDDLPAELRPLAEQLYVARGGKYVLNTEDEPLADSGRRALDNERRLRAEAVKQAEAMRQQMAELEAKMNDASRTKPAETPAAGGTDDIQKQLASQKAEFDRNLQRLEKALGEERGVREKAESRLAETKIVDALRQAALDAGVLDTAIPDAINRARQVWRMGENGEPAPYDGEAVIYSHKDPTRPMSPREHLDTILRDAPHLLRPSGGGGAQGGASARASGVITVSRSDLRDAATYQRVQEQAAKSGATIQVAD